MLEKWMLGLQVGTLMLVGYLFSVIPSTRSFQSNPRENAPGIEAESVSRGENISTRRDDLAVLRRDIRRLGDRLEERIASLEQRMGQERSPTDGELRDERSELEDAQARKLADRMFQDVQSEIEEKFERIHSRQRDRGIGGGWKAPMDALAAELKLSDEQREAAVEVFQEGKDRAMDLLQRSMNEEQNLMEKLVADLQREDPKAWEKLFHQIFNGTIPGTRETYASHLENYSRDIYEQLSGMLTPEQMKQLKELEVSVLEVETGYDPFKDYLEAAMGE